MVSIHDNEYEVLQAENAQRFHCVENKAFKKSIRVYKQYESEIYEIVNQILEDPYQGELFQAWDYRQVRHLKNKRLGPNFALYYTICEDARCELQNGKCPWCTEKHCEAIIPGTIMLLRFGTHQITDRIK